MDNTNKKEVIEETTNENKESTVTEKVIIKEVPVVEIREKIIEREVPVEKVITEKEVVEVEVPVEVIK